MKHSWTDPHVKIAFKNLLKALYITLGTFAILYAVFLIGRTAYSNNLSKVSSEAFHRGLTQELAHLTLGGDSILENKDLIASLLASRREEVLEILQRESAARDIPRLAVSDRSGVVLSRSASAGRFGDNVFLTSPGGRAVSSGRSIASVEATGYYNQIFLTTARPIYVEGEMVGALFANAFLDDIFAEKFKNTYLTTGSEIAFYTKDKGVYGTSFKDKETKNLIASYMAPGSRWIQDAYSNAIIIFDNGHSYLVSNITLTGLEGETGGALIFTPRIDASRSIHSIIAILVILIFLFLVVKNHLETKSEERGFRYWIILSFFAILTFAGVFYFQKLPESGIARLHRVPYSLYNSTIALEPEWGIYNVGTEQKFTVVVNTGDEKINTIGVGLTFDPAKVEVVDVDSSTSPCSYVVEREVNNTDGFIHFSCVILNDKSWVETLPVLTVTTKLLKTGTFDLAFDPAHTSVLASDGLGTDVLRTSQDGSYKVDDFDLESEHATSTKRNFVVFSPTHPNQARWYNGSTVKFVWIGEPQAIYAYDFDTSPTTVPDGTLTTQEKSLTLNIPGDGIYYLHIKTLSSQAVAHYKIQSDHTPPTILNMSFDKDEYAAGEVARTSILANDVSSGIQNNYYVDLGDRLFLPTGPMLFIPFIESGTKTLRLRVYDRAGNYVEEVRNIKVQERK